MSLVKAGKHWFAKIGDVDVVACLVDIEDVNHVSVKLKIVPFDDRYYKIYIEGYPHQYLIKVDEIDKIQKLDRPVHKISV